MDREDHEYDYPGPSADAPGTTDDMGAADDPGIADDMGAADDLGLPALTGSGASASRPEDTAERSSARVRDVPTGLRGEPVPGMGAPRPRPAAPAAPEPSTRRRRLLIGGAVASVCALALLLGSGALLLARPWEDTGEADAGAATSVAAAAPARTVTVDDATVTVTSLESGLSQVGSGADRRDAEGEYVAIVATVANDGDEVLFWDRAMDLVGTDGATHTADGEATSAYDSDADDNLIIPPGETANVKIVYDVPIGTSPESATVRISRGGDETTGTLPL